MHTPCTRTQAEHREVEVEKDKAEKVRSKAEARHELLELLLLVATNLVATNLVATKLCTRNYEPLCTLSY